MLAGLRALRLKFRAAITQANAHVTLARSVVRVISVVVPSAVFFPPSSRWFCLPLEARCQSLHVLLLHRPQKALLSFSGLGSTQSQVSKIIFDVSVIPPPKVLRPMLMRGLYFSRPSY